ncbi:MAG: hypothetical protein K2X02_09040 [Alphaproteobacteria bacterium]|nr:hypothetical protein [Alphaproteobacteria bacterium]
MRLRFVLVLIFLSLLFNLSSYAFDAERDDFYKLYPTLKPAKDDPWQDRLFTKLPDAVLDQLHERNKKNFASKKDFLSAVQMTDSQQLIQMGDFIYNKRLLIGEGEEGHVYLARHIPSGCYVAVKTPVRTSEYEAFRNLGRCYAHFTSDSRDYLFTPFIMGTPLSQYYFDEERLYVRVDSHNNKVSYSNWTHNLRLLDAFLAELERGIHYEGTPREFDSKSMFVVDEFSEKPKVVFVDLEEGGYTPKGLDYIPDEFCVSMFLLLGSQGSTRMRELVFPQPIQDFFDKASNGDGFHVRLTEIKKARNQLMEEMQQLGYPGLSLDESSVASEQAPCSSHEY